jgi:hypothetical protein
MRRTIILASAILFSVLSVPGAFDIRSAGAAECSGENCPPPSQGQGRDCEHERKEQTTS